MNKKIKIILGTGIVVAVMFAALGWYALIFEPNNIQVEEVAISVDNLPESFEGVKIVHLTDFHSFGFNEKEKRIVEIVNKINPDFVFITGDFVDTKTKDFDSCAEFWQELSKHYQGRIFGVLGNHDLNSLEKSLERSNINILDNESIKIFQGDEHIYLVGVNDPDTRRDDFEKAMLGARKGIPKILLAHSSDIINDLQIGESPDLILVGHSHGGQVKIPFLVPFWVPTENRGKFASGLFQIDNTYMYVNRGVGTTALPIRFNCPPEIAVIELKSK